MKSLKNSISQRNSEEIKKIGKNNNNDNNNNNTNSEKRKNKTKK